VRLVSAHATRAKTLVGAVTMASSVASCVQPYRPPTDDEPHATLKIRRVYEKTAGTRLDEVCAVEGHPALTTATATPVAGAPLADGFLIYPRPARVDMKSTFSHQQWQNVTEAYTEQVPHMDMETYNCGFGTSYRTCSQMVTHYRSETKYRTVTRLVDVTDSACSLSLFIAPAVGHTYLVDFTYRDQGVCAATCIEQIATHSDGSFESAPCPAPTPEQAQQLAPVE
jgi:hypothetical protein